MTGEEVYPSSVVYEDNAASWQSSQAVSSDHTIGLPYKRIGIILSYKHMADQFTKSLCRE